MLLGKMTTSVLYLPSSYTIPNCYQSDINVCYFKITELLFKSLCHSDANSVSCDLSLFLTCLAKLVNVFLP